MNAAYFKEVFNDTKLIFTQDSKMNRVYVSLPRQDWGRWGEIIPDRMFYSVPVTSNTKRHNELVALFKEKLPNFNIAYESLNRIK